MLDVAHLTQVRQSDTQIFLPTTIAAVGFYQLYTVPRGKNWLWITAIGGGGGGGGGFTAASGTSKGGGGGGGSGAISHAMVPTLFLPDRLYISVTSGGVGSTGSGVAGTAGANTNINLGPNALEKLIQANAGGGGGAGTTTAGGAAGSFGALPTNLEHKLLFALGGTYQASAGQPGVAGASSTAAGTTHFLLGASVFTCPGTGGGSANSTGGVFNPGQINVSNAPNLFPAGAYTGANAGGADGFVSRFASPIVLIGGMGGVGSGTVAGQAGGAGAIGCGGGGGAGGTTGGVGGRGGPGCVIIMAF